MKVGIHVHKVIATQSEPAGETRKPYFVPVSPLTSLISTFKYAKLLF